MCLQTLLKLRLELKFLAIFVVISMIFVLFLFIQQDNGSAKYFQGTRQTINMGEKVAQVSGKENYVHEISRMLGTN